MCHSCCSILRPSSRWYAYGHATEGNAHAHTGNGSTRNARNGSTPTGWYDDGWASQRTPGDAYGVSPQRLKNWRVKSNEFVFCHHSLIRLDIGCCDGFSRDVYGFRRNFSADSDTGAFSPVTWHSLHFPLIILTYSARHLNPTFLYWGFFK